MNKNWVFVFGVISLIMSFSLASATISLSQPKAVYNIGDDLNINATIQSSQGGNGFFVAEIVCGERNIELLRMPYSVKPGQTNQIQVNAMLDRTLIGSLEGRCSVKASYSSETASTNEFDLTSKVIVNVDIQGNLFAPKDKIVLSGTAFLVNGLPVSGVTVFEIPSANVTSEGTVTEGKFSASFELPSKIASGLYDLRVIISQRDEYGNLLNSGVITEPIKIKQVVQSAEVALSNTTIQPGAELSYQLVLYDQVLAKTTQDAIVKLISPAGIVVSEKFVTSGNAGNSFVTAKDYSPGVWTVQANAGNVTTSKNFVINELRDVSVTREDRNLVIRNTGNVIYNTPLEIQIGDKVESIELNLEVGQEKRMKLFAPDGEYNINTKVGGNEIQLGTTFLTGNAIKISDLSDIQAAKIKMWFWIFVVVIGGILLYMKYRKFRKNRVFTSASSGMRTVMTMNMKKSKAAEDENFIWKSSSAPKEERIVKLSGIQQSKSLAKMEDFGRKEEVSVLVLKIKNNDELTKYKGSEPAMNAIVQAVGIARGMKAKVTREENFTVMTFSKTATGSQNPHLEAAKAGKDIEALFKSHNRKYARKIVFGLGLATGEMIVEKQGSSIQHTSLGNSVPLAKKIASHANDSLLLEQNTHNKLRGLVKSDMGIGGMYWSINSFVNREDHNQFIKKFMERRADESKSF